MKQKALRVGGKVTKLIIMVIHTWMKKKTHSNQMLCILFTRIMVAIQIIIINSIFKYISLNTPK